VLTDLLNDPNVTLPDGTPPNRWDRPPRHTRTYVVDQASPAASDDGEGTAEQPFRTIGRGAQAVQPGERVLVRAGIYREQVQPSQGGDGPDAMVTFEAEPGHHVVIRGSCVLPSAWERSAEADGVWTIRLQSEDVGADHPFLHENVDRSDPNSYQSSVPTERSAADTHRRGLLFQDGARLTQVGSFDDLAKAPGRYLVAADGWTLHARPFGEHDPNAVCMEATNRRQLFAPARPGVSFVRLTGFVIEHAGNGFSYPVEAAVSPMGGHHWIIEDNIVREVSSDGVNVGGHVWEWGGNQENLAGRDCIVRRNTIGHCGVSGIKGMTPGASIIEDNVIEHIGWQDVELWYDNGGMKLLVCRSTLVRHNLIRDILDGPGIWLDWDDSNCRVTQNVVVDSRGASGGIFMEGSEQQNWVDHNLIWNITGNGIFQQDCDGLTVFDNVVGRCTGAAVYMFVCTERELHGRKVTCKRNDVRSNVFVDNGVLVFFSDPENSSDHNVVADSHNPNALAEARQATGQDAHSVQLPVEAVLAGTTVEFAPGADAPPLVISISRT
jgi:alpha-N-arabinofuranosidase